MGIIIINICIGPSHRMRSKKSSPTTTLRPHAPTSHYILQLLLTRNRASTHSNPPANAVFLKCPKTLHRPVIASPQRAKETISATMCEGNEEKPPPSLSPRWHALAALIKTEIVYISHSVILISIESIMCTGQITFLAKRATGIHSHTDWHWHARLNEWRTKKAYRIRFIYFPSIN